MSRPHVPQRTCVGCRATRPRRELVRLVAPSGGGEVHVDPTGRVPGRGAYLCAVSAADCLRAAGRRRALPRALRTTGEAVDLDRLLADLATPAPAGPSAAPEVLSSPL